MFKLHSLYMTSALSALSACNIGTPRALNAGHPPPGIEAETPLGPYASSTKQAKSQPADQFVSHHKVPQGSSFYQMAKNLGVEAPTILEWVKTAKDSFPLDEVVAGTAFSITWDSIEKTSPQRLELKYAADSSLVIEKGQTDLEWTASKVQLPVKMVQKTFSGSVESSLWESAETGGMDPSLIIKLTEVFAWQVDFNRSVKKGDRWRLTVEQKLVNDEVIGWGPILVAEYENSGQSFTGIRYPQTGETGAYYAPNGQSLKRMFLKSPIKFGRITSGFSQSRFHPILNVNRPHNGVDYGAPRGTPIMAVGKGRIVSMGFNRSNGRMIKIRHNGIYATAYLHMDRFAPGLKLGSEIEQGQFIGTVGSSGLATGPHLHFSFYENGVYVDPMGIKFPSADPIAANEMPAYQKLVSTMLQSLPAWQLAENSEAMKGPYSLSLDRSKGEDEGKTLMH